MSLNEDFLRFTVLGPVRSWRGEAELDLGSPQQRVVLAALLLRRGRPVTLSELLDAVWGEEPPPAAVSVLRTYISRLRKVLEPRRDAVDAARVVVSVGDGYLVRLQDDALDLAVFERRVAEAAKARAAGEMSAAADLLHAALGAWQGAALAGLPGPLAESEGSRLNQERLSALESRLDIDVTLGRHGEVIAELTSLTAKYPLWEQLCRLLMLALYRSGRQAEALAAYRRTRGVLVAELGIEPGAPLRELHDRILAADTSLVADPPRQPDPPPKPASPDVPPATRPAQLPPGLSTFVGRNAELAWSRDLLFGSGTEPSTVVISSIGGMAGVGKSALAVHWAHQIADRFPDGQLYINLRGFDPTGSVVTPDEAIRVFLDGLGVPPMRIPAGLEAQAALYRSLLAHRRVLILLDNARDSEQVRPLLPGNPGCTVIVTSRNKLTGLVVSDGAHPLTLNPMTPVEARALLARRLGTGRLEAEPRAADEIIARCAQLPLALAIVAAHAAAHPVFPLIALAEELRDSHGSLDAFVAGDDLTTDVRAVFSWSYQALSDPAARLFTLLGLHSGPDLSAPAAAGLAGLPPRDTRRLLTELTRAHLLTEPFPGRYALHDLLRVYAEERVRADRTPREREEAVERLLAWYLHTADAAYPQITPRRRRIPLEPPPASCRPLEFTTQEQALEWCETERANLVAAVHQAGASGLSGIAWRLPAVLWGFFYLRSHMLDWFDTARTGLSAARAADDRPGEAQGLMDTAAALRSAGRFDEAVEELHRAVAAYEELGDTDGLGSATGNLGDAYLQSDQLDHAVEYIKRSMDIERQDGTAWAKGISLANLGDVYQRLGRFDEAIDALEEALVILRANDNRWVEGVTYDILGTIHCRLQHYDQAVEYYHLALKAHRDVCNRWGEGDTLYNLGDARQAAGDSEAAYDSWRQALALFTEFDHPDAQKARARLDGRDVPPDA
ncbi:BTAD domain-containing putative transcriptional regulator [Streptomyces sp. NPDC058001]|uniref:AfsR/SARP family transcriptional regulator n=1 Tax=Streptomyces sp. NPDC058001 TaxID=3346300 RepID=UPI0036E293BF